MSTNKISKGTILDPGLCRCCGSWKKCRVLNEEYVYSGETEVYSDKFVDCFGLLLSYLDAEITKRLICATCVGRLREACSFRQQVLLCEEKLLKSEIQVHTEEKQDYDVKEEKVNVEIKYELCYDNTVDEPYDGDVTNDGSLPEANSEAASKPDNGKTQMLSQIKQTKLRLRKLQKVKSDNDDMDDLPLSKTFHMEISRNTARKRKAKSNESGEDNLKMLSEIKKTKGKLKKLNSDEKQDYDVKEEKVNVEIKYEPCYDNTVDEPYDGDVTNDGSSPEANSQAASKPDNGKTQMLSQIKQTKLRLRKLQKVKNKPTRKLNSAKTGALDDSRKARANTITLVENSYVCPFYSIYNDFYCPYCDEKFIDPTKLKNHVVNHDEKSYKKVAAKKKLAQIDISRIDCRLCPETINDLNHFKSHIANEHKKVLYNEVTNQYLTFILKDNNFACTECNATYGFFHNLKKHMAAHFGSYTCDICGTHFFFERLLLLHQKSHDKSVKLNECKDCGKTFRSKNCWNIHVASVHTKEAIYDCSKCNQAFFTEALRHKHMKAAHGVEERTYACEQCDKIFLTRRYLYQHVRNIHVKLFKHQCEICQRGFNLPGPLKEHMTFHTGEKNYKCPDCGKAYCRLKSLNVHIQTHNSEKKYICAVCGKTFTQKFSMKNHVKKQHQHL